MKSCCRFVLCLLLALLSSLTLTAQNSKKEKQLNQYLQNGYNFLKQNQTKKAIQQYKEALKIDKSSHNAYYNLGFIYANSRQFTEALAIIDQALLNCTEDLGSFYRLKANCLSDSGRYEESLPLFFKDLETHSKDSANVYYNLGYTYLKLQKYTDALLYLKKYIEGNFIKKGNYGDALFYAGTCSMHLDDNLSAIGYFDSALLKKKYYTFYHNKAEALNRLGRNGEALSVINEGIESNPDQEILYHKRYQIYRDLKQKDKSFEDLKKAYSINPNDGDILLDMGTLYSEDNRMDDAIRCYHKCIALNENVISACSNLAGIYQVNNVTLDSAVFYYKKMIALAPAEGTYYFNFGNYYKDISNYDRAIELYNKAIELSPSLSGAYTNAAVVYSLKKNTDEAIKYVKKALDIDPNDDQDNALLASLYFDKLDYDNTVVFATNALRINKKSRSVIQILSLRATSRQLLGDYKNALYDYLDILELYDDEQKKQASSILSNIGYCYLEDNQLENALKYFTDAVDSKAEIDQLIGLFTVEYLLKDKVAFYVTLNKAITIDPKLKQGYKGIEILETDGYFYTEKHKKILKKILAN